MLPVTGLYVQYVRNLANTPIFKVLVTGNQFAYFI